MHKKLIDTIVLGITFILNIFFAIVIFGSLDNHEIHIYIWSDTLYLPSIFKDLFIDGSDIGTWNLNGAPNFFPDMLLYMLINSFTDNFIIALFLFSIIQYAYLLLFSFLFVRSFFPKTPWYILSVGMLLMMLFLFITTITNNYTYTFLLFSVSFHLSAYILTLVCAWQAIMYFRSGKLVNIIVYGAIAFLASLSDKLFIVIYIVPSLAWLVFIRNKKVQRKLIVYYTTTIFVVVLSIIVYNLLNATKILDFITITGKTFHFENIVSSYKVMLDQHWSYIKFKDFRGIVNILAIVFLLIALFRLVKKGRLLFSKEDLKEPEFLELAFLVFTISSVIITFNAPAINGYYLGWAILRFNVYAIILSVLAYSYLFVLLKEWKPRVARYFIPVFLALFISFSIIHGISFTKKYDAFNSIGEFFDFKPDWAVEIDSALHKNDIQYGISEYVFAKNFTMFSEYNNRIYHVHRNGRPWHHVTNENWYYGGKKGKFANPEFEFVITNKLDRELLIKKFDQYILDTIQLRKSGLEILVTEPFIFEKGTKSIVMLSDSTVIINK